MKVAIVSHSDITGGAAIASLRLAESLIAAGVDARLVVNRRSRVNEDKDYIVQAGDNLLSRACFLYEHANIFASNGFSRENLFKISVASCGLPLHRHPVIKEADIVVLNWVNQGMISLKEIGRLSAMGKIVVWVLHDMWPMTGICHYAEGCDNFKDICHDCKLLSWEAGRRDLSTRTQKRKYKLYNRYPSHFVAVSNWLAEMGRQSMLLRDQDLSVIHDTFPYERFAIESMLTRRDLGLPKDPEHLVVMGAARLDTPIKGLDTAIEALNILADKGRNDIGAVFFGSFRNPELLDSLRMEHKWVGPVNDPDFLAEIYAQCSVVLSAAKYETFGLTLIEGAAAGAIPVSFGCDGREDIITHQKTGYIADYGSAADLAAGIEWAIGSHIDRRELSRYVGERFSPAVIAAEYIKLFERLMSERSKQTQ